MGELGIGNRESVIGNQEWEMGCWVKMNQDFAQVISKKQFLEKFIPTNCRSVAFSQRFSGFVK
jgi:hypothetical protein